MQMTCLPTWKIQREWVVWGGNQCLSMQVIVSAQKHREMFPLTIVMKALCY